MAFDYTVLDMPTHLGRTVLVQDSNDETKWVRDDKWYEETRVVFRSLYDFFILNNLLVRANPTLTIDELVLRFSDFTPVGQQLLKSGAVDNWLESFDRPGSKKARTDVRYLEKALRKQAEGPTT